MEGKFLTEDIILPYIVFFQLINSPVIEKYTMHINNLFSNNKNEISSVLKEVWKNISEFVISEGIKKIGKKYKIKIL